MGTYTELYLSVELTNLDETALKVLTYLFDDNIISNDKLLENNLSNKINHPFFKCERWSFIGNSASYYFTPYVVNKFVKDDINDDYYLITKSDLKNYNNEIKLFCDWLYPYLSEYEGHLGHWRCQEDYTPTLIYYKDSKEEFLEQFKY